MPKKEIQTDTISTIKRPLSVTLLSILHLAFGAVFVVVLLITIVYTFIGKDELTNYIQSLGMAGYTPMILIIVLSLLTIIAFVSGIGMLKGSKIGWHFAAFYYGYNIFRNVNALFFIQRPFSIFPLEALTSFINDPKLYYVKYAVRGTVFLLFYVLMNTKKFREYFGLQLEHNLLVLLVQYVILIAIASILSGVL